MIRQSHKRLNISPLRYPGGKSALYPYIRSLIRRSGLSGCTYIEPYAGGAGAGLGLLLTGQVSRLVINDLDPAIHAFWSLLCSSPSSLAARVLSTPLDVSEWRRQKEIYSSASRHDTAALGFATLYLNRTNRSGVLNGGPIGGLDQSGPYKIDARFSRLQLAERIEAIGLYASDITVLSQEGTDVISEFAVIPKTFIYADPPYIHKAGSLYMNSFKMDDHECLAGVLNELAQSSWLLTYDDDPIVHQLYCSRRRRTLSLFYSANGASRASEIAVLSDGLPDLDGVTGEEESA
jgi:DNA adenine methylase